MLAIPFAILVAVAVGVAIWQTYGTPLWWVPGSLLFALAAAILFGFSVASSLDRREYGLQALGDVLLVAAAGGSSVMGLLVLAITRSDRRRTQALRPSLVRVLRELELG